MQGRVTFPEFVHAAGVGNINTVKQYIAERKGLLYLLNVTSADDCALSAAALGNHVEVIKLLIAEGVRAYDYDELANKLGASNFKQVRKLLRDHHERAERERIVHSMINEFGLNANIHQQNMVKLSLKNLQRLRKITDNLVTTKLLNDASVTEAIHRVSHSLVDVPESTIVSTTAVGTSAETKIASDNARPFYLPNGSTVEPMFIGGQAKIFKGTQDVEAGGRVEVGVKIFINGSEGNVLSPKELARREARYLNQQGRKVMWFIDQAKDEAVTVSDWVKGNGLYNRQTDSVENVSGYSLERRYQWLVSVFADLNLLHQDFRLHGDARVDNCVLDKNNNTMHLIDFGSAQKVASNKELAACPMYIDHDEGAPRTLASDMFGMSYVVAALFPELFEEVDPKMRVMRMGNLIIMLGLAGGCTINQIKHDNLSPVELAVIDLVNAMRMKQLRDRCSSQQALEFCSAIYARLQVANELKEEERVDITNRTINRGYYTVEDAMRDCGRPALFPENKAVLPLVINEKAEQEKRDSRRQKLSSVGNSQRLFDTRKTSAATKTENKADKTDSHAPGCVMM